MNSRHVEKRRRTWLAIVLGLAATGAWLPAVALQNANEERWAKRDAWQRPAEVMDALGITAGSTVADVGCGQGYFSFRMAARVGPQGKVYAVDVSKEDLEKIRSRVEKDGLKQMEVILSQVNDPQLPAGAVDAILAVNAYHEMREYDRMLQGMFRALKPGGLLGIIDHTAAPGEPREEYFKRHRMPEELVREDAARNGFAFLARPPGFKNADGEDWYFLIFKKPPQ